MEEPSFLVHVECERIMEKSKETNKKEKRISCQTNANRFTKFMLLGEVELWIFVICIDISLYKYNTQNSAFEVNVCPIADIIFVFG